MEVNKFHQLWEETSNSVSHEIRSLVHNKDRNLVKKVNAYYYSNILNKLWFSENFACDYSEYMNTIKTQNPMTYERIKSFLYSNITLITDDEESKLVSSILFSGGISSALLGMCRKNARLLIISLGVTAIAYFYNRYNQNKIIELANSLVRKKLLHIGQGVENILKES